MCGIVGLLIKDPKKRDRLGEWMVPMLVGMTERGPDSAGMAVFGKPVSGRHRKLSLYAGNNGFDWKVFEKAARKGIGEISVTAKANHAVLETAEADRARAWLKAAYPGLHLLSVGRSIDLYKDTGLPGDIAKRYGFDKVRGSHVVGHTRMATESAVTPAHAHPFTAGEDFCLVHNGSLSNPFSIRRKLEARGVEFDTDNDTEGATRYLEWRMREGDSLEQALEKGFEEFDGFYTFLMGTRDELAVVRDAFSCKPAVVAETDDYVAISSEFRSLAHLPGVKDASLFEPKPEQMYVWRA
ncbi:MAG: amidophosphoribosyltransferase [Betaproteobacteria bacterium]